MPKPKYAYSEVILSGRPVFMAEGLDYTELPEMFTSRWQTAAKRRGLKLATRISYDPVGIIMQAYIPANGRPVLPDPPTTIRGGFAKRHLYCSRNGCQNRLSANEMKYRECADHRD